MAAEILQPSQTTIQPTQQEAPIPTNAFDVGAGVFGQAASDTVQAANAQGQRAAGLFDKANAYFDRTVDQYNKIAVMNAQDEAPGLIQKDGNGQIIPPTSFWPTGIHSLAYGQAYAEAARSTYRTMAASEFSNFVSETQAKYPTDATAFKKAVDDKQALMLQNLDPKEAPFISLRLQQIASQGGTQVAVNLQAANNATLKAQSDVSYAAIVDTASRQAGIAAPTAAFGGKDNAAVPGAISTITGSLDPEIQKRITSSDRTPEINAQVGGATDSAHLKAGTAVDIGTAGMTDEQKKALVSQVLASPNLRGIGFYDDHIHIDTGHDKHTVWGAVPSSVQNDVRNWQGAPTAMTAVPTSTDIEKIKTQVASSALVAGMLADWQKQVGPIMTPAEIARKKDELAYTVVAKSYAETFKSGNYSDGKGNVDQGKIALAEENIEKIAQAFPGREDQVRKTLQEGLQFSITRSSRFAAQQQLDDKRRIEPQQRRAMDLALQADALKNTDIDGARRITDQLRQEARTALNNPSINDAAALQLAQTYYTNGNLAKSSMQEGITNKVQGLNAVVNDPTASQDQKAAAYESAKAIRNDPDLYGSMTAGQRNYLQGTLDGYVKLNYGTQVQAFNSKILEGETSPAKIDEVRAEQVAKNMIPPEQIMQMAVVDAEAKKRYREKQTQSKLAGEVIENVQTGRPSTTEQIEAHKKEVNWSPPGGAPSVNYRDPAHVKAVGEFYQKNGYLPDLAKSALDATPHSPDEAAIAGQKATLETIRQVERDKVARRTGNRNYDPTVESMLESDVAAIVGKNYSFLANATKFNSAAVAAKISEQVGPQPSVAGAAGQTPDQLNANLNQAGKNLEGLLQKNRLNVVSQAIGDPGGVLRSDQQSSAEEKALKAGASIAPDGGPGAYLKTMIPGLQGQGDYAKVEIDPNLMKDFVSKATAHIAADGKSIHAGLAGKGSVEDFAMNTAFFTAVRNGEVSATRSEDGTTMRIGWKSLASQISPILGVAVTPQMEKVFAAQLIENNNVRTGQSNLIDIPPEYTSVVPYQSPNGERRFFISVKDRNGNFVAKEDLAANDPRISTQALATFKAATQAVIANSQSGITPQGYGTAIGAALLGPLGTLVPFSDAMGGVPLASPLEGKFRFGTMIGGTLEQMQLALNRPGVIEAVLGNNPLLSDQQKEVRKNMQVDSIRMLSQLDDRLKQTKDAPNLAEVLSQMAQEHAPGLDSSALRQLIKDAGFFQIGRQRPVVTGPSRIGTESR